ncbi:cuticle protein CP1499-like [Panulirus ornatus]|uniref:cuticle protein CP1499-like n=1 Tax=Panulirus ornatus TaxID=150431 RepID=UPI003A8363D7
MRTLVVLAVMGVCSASYQAYNPGPAHYSAPAQPKWVGPVASSVPAGVNGKVIPVSDTPEVAAARNAFFRAYQNQLAAVSGPRYGSGHAGPSFTHAAPAHSYSVSTHVSAPVHVPAAPVHVPAAPVHIPAAHVHVSGGSYGAPAVHVTAHGYHGAPTQVGDTPEVAAAKAEFFRTYERQAAAAAAAPDDYTHNTYH